MVSISFHTEQSKVHFRKYILNEQYSGNKKVFSRILMQNTNQVPGKEAWSLQRAAKDASVKSGSPLGLEISISCFSHLDTHKSSLLHQCQSKSNSFANYLFLSKARMPLETASRVWLWLHLPLTPLFPLVTARGRKEAGTGSPYLGARFLKLPGTDGHNPRQRRVPSLLGRSPEAKAHASRQR